MELARFGTRMTQKVLKQKILNDYLEMNMRIWMIILKWLLKEVVLFLDLILHYNTANSGCFGNVNGFVLLKTIKTSKVLQMNLSE
jgi:hypothetical protein